MIYFAVTAMIRVEFKMLKRVRFYQSIFNRNDVIL